MHGGARRLSSVVLPADGESLGSWVDRAAADYGTSTGNAARWLGLDCRVGAGGSTLRPRLYGIALTPSSTKGLTAATGLPPAVFESMCLSRFADTALDFTALDVQDERTLRPVAIREWALFTSTRACPRCLAESGGIWQLWWRLGIAAVCVRHQVLLLDNYPACGLPLRRGHINRGGDVPRRRMANPLLCGNSGPGVAEPDESGQCSCRMDTVDTPAASAELVAVQRAALAVALGASSSMVGATVTPRQWFHGLRFVAALHRMFASVDFVRECEGMPPCAVEAFTETARRRSTRHALRAGMPPSAAHAAADLLLAAPVLAAADPSECAGQLLPVAQAEAELLATHVDRRDRMWTVDRPDSLDWVWRARTHPACPGTSGPPTATVGHQRRTHRLAHRTTRRPTIHPGLPRTRVRPQRTQPARPR
jgi:TniQ protein